MVYLVSYENLEKVPIVGRLMIAERRRESKLRCFSPLELNSTFELLVWQKGISRAIREWLVLTYKNMTDESRALVKRLKNGEDSVIVVLQEDTRSLAASIRCDLLEAWQIAYGVVV